MINDNTPQSTELRQFGLIMGVAVVVVFAVLLPWIWDFPSPHWPWLIAIPFWSFGMIAPFMLAPVYRAWMKVGHLLGWFNTRLIMGIVFFLIMVPMGLILRLFNGTQILRTQKKQGDSFRLNSTARNPEHFRRLF